ncbi:MAG: hypothetical protein GC164_16135 [Phycisphaera sp.]|nr:hypothetical protein [Phycisphaera sp.]
MSPDHRKDTRDQGGRGEDGLRQEVLHTFAQVTERVKNAVNKCKEFNEPCRSTSTNIVIEEWATTLLPYWSGSRESDSPIRRVFIDAYDQYQQLVRHTRNEARQSVSYALTAKTTKKQNGVITQLDGVLETIKQCLNQLPPHDLRKYLDRLSQILKDHDPSSDTPFPNAAPNNRDGLLNIMKAGLTTMNLAAYLGCSEELVRGMRKDAGIPGRGRKAKAFTPKQVKQIAETRSKAKQLDATERARWDDLLKHLDELPLGFKPKATSRR